MEDFIFLVNFGIVLLFDVLKEIIVNLLWDELSLRVFEMFLDKVFVFEVVKKGNVIILKDRVIIEVLLKFIRDFMRNCSGNFL